MFEYAGLGIRFPNEKDNQNHDHVYPMEFINNKLNS